MEEWIRPCEQSLTAEKAQGIRLMIERLTGEACPCDQGLVCPLFPELRPVLREQVGMTRVA